MRAAELRKQWQYGSAWQKRSRYSYEVPSMVKRVSESALRLAVYVVRVTISSRERDGSRARSAASRGPALGGIRYPS